MAKAPLTPERTKLMELVIQDINTTMHESFHTIQGLPQGTLKFPDGTFKRKELIGGQELVFQAAYLGKSGKIIFTFTPGDDRDWDQVEFDAVGLDKALPLFGGELAEANNIDGLESVPAIVGELMAICEYRLEEEKVEEEAANANLFSTNPLFGRFG